MAFGIATVKASISQEALTRAANVALTRAIKRKRDVIRTRLNRRFTNLVEYYLKTHPVMKSIRGVGATGSTLQDEFGLTDSLAEDAFSSIVEAITGAAMQERAKSSVVTQRVGTNVVFEVGFSGINIDAIESLIPLESSPFTYVSSPSGIEIPWMRLLLNAARATVEDYIDGVGGFAILRNPTGKLRQYSRSGGALMVDLEATEGPHVGLKLINAANFPYVMPRIAVPSNPNARNFIDEILRSQAFRKDVRDAITSTIREVL